MIVNSGETYKFLELGPLLGKSLLGAGLDAPHGRRETLDVGRQIKMVLLDDILPAKG